MVFSTSTVLCKHRINLVSNHFHHPQKEALYPWAPTPHPAITGQPPVYLVSLWTDLFLVFLVNGTHTTWPFYIWLLSQSTLFFEVQPCSLSVPHCFLRAELCSTVGMDHVLFVHSSIGRHSECFQPFFFLFFFFLVWLHCVACGTSVLQPGIRPTFPAVEAWVLNQWTARDVPTWVTF